MTLSILVLMYDVLLFLEYSGTLISRSAKGLANEFVITAFRYIRAGFSIRFNTTGLKNMARFTWVLLYYVQYAKLYTSSANEKTVEGLSNKVVCAKI